MAGWLDGWMAKVNSPIGVCTRSWKKVGTVQSFWFHVKVALEIKGLRVLRHTLMSYPGASGNSNFTRPIGTGPKHSQKATGFEQPFCFSIFLLTSLRITTRLL